MIHNYTSTFKTFTTLILLLLSVQINAQNIEFTFANEEGEWKVIGMEIEGV